MSQAMHENNGMIRRQIGMACHQVEMCCCCNRFQMFLRVPKRVNKPQLMQSEHCQQFILFTYNIID